MVMSDLNKSYWRIMQNDAPEYVLIDFIDERYLIGRTENSYFTLSDEFKAGNCMIEYSEVERVIRESEYYIDEIPLSIYLDEFISRIKTVIPDAKVILHKARMMNYYRTTGGGIKRFSEDYCKYNDQINDMLNFMYDYFESKVEDCIILECKEEYYADERHKWGLMPMHYEENYYKDVYQKLYDLVRYDKVQKAERGKVSGFQRKNAKT